MLSKRIVLLGSLLVIALSISLLPWRFSDSAMVFVKTAHASNQCVLSSVYPRTLNQISHRNALDVIGTTNASGYFLYYNPISHSWNSVRWSPWYLLGNSGVRFGVSTTWTWSHPWWKNTSWRYIYPC